MAIAFFIAPFAYGATFTVNNSGDLGIGACGTLGICTLRQAITAANANAGADTIAFNLAGSTTITVLSALPAITESVVIDGSSQPGFAGAPIVTVTSSTPNSYAGLTVNAGPTVIRSLVINGFSTGIAIAASNVIVEGCYIGTDATGSTAVFNAADISITGASNVQIGGTTAAQRNVISGSQVSVMIDSASSANVVLGNYIGTNAAGTAAVSSADGVEIDGSGNTIGGTTASARNIISGNLLRGVAVAGSGNLIEGNYIGTDVTGTVALGNGTAGVVVFGSNNTVGGAVVGAGDVISANGEDGISVASGSGHVIAGNRIGTNATGDAPLANGANPPFPGAQTGGIVMASAGNRIGGTTTAERNVISGNAGFGVLLNPGASGATIEGNIVGLNAAGSAAIPNSSYGVLIFTDGNTFGGSSSGSRNIVSGNGNDGVTLSGNSNLVQGNYLGTDITGNAAIGNHNSGVASFGSNNEILGNLASGNGTYGISVLGPVTGNIVQGNLVGTNAAGTAPLGNSNTGVAQLLAGGNPTAPTNTLIGGTTAAARNVISGNAGDGINITGAATANTIQGNYLGTDITGTASIPNAFDAVAIAGSNNIVGGTTAAARNVVSGNIAVNAGGMSLNGATATGNSIQGNFIGVAANGAAALPNTDYGIAITGGASNNIIGGPAAGAGNVIANNSGQGVDVAQGTGNQILGNQIFANGALGIDLEPIGVTPNDVGDADTGPNNLQNFPVLSMASSIGGNTAIVGTLNSTPSTTFRVEFFANASCDPSGNGEGQQFLGFTTVTTDPSGNASFTFNAPVASTGVATATATSPSGDTSEFSACLAINTIAPSLSINDVSVVEGNSGTTPATFTVTLSSPSLFTTTVNYATADGTATAPSDYAATSGTLTFPAGTTSQTITVNVNGDLLNEPDETFTVNLSGPVNASISKAQGTGTILNDDPVPSLSINSVSQAEGNSGTTNFVFTVTLSAPSGQTVAVNYATANGTAQAGSDYNSVSGTLTFAPGVTTQTITVPVIGDTTNEPDETFTVNLSSPANATIATPSGSGTIVNDDGAPVLSINSVSQPEGNSGTTSFVFTVTLSAPSGQIVTVNYATADGTAKAGSDYNAVSGTLTFNAGVITQTINVPVVGDTVPEPDETFTVNLTSPVNATIATATGTGTIVNDDVATADVAISKTANGTIFLRGQNATFTITVSNQGPDTATGVTVTDPLPAGSTFVSASATQGTCSGTTVVTCALGTLANAASATVTLTVNLSNYGALTNIATVSATQVDNNASNNSASATIATDIPVFDDRIRIALILALAVIALSALSKRV